MITTMSRIYYIISTFILSLTIFLILFFISPPNSVKFHITELSLTRFNLTTNTLNYKFNVSIIARNPNNDVKINYRRITAIAWYKDNDFAWVSLGLFEQDHKNTTFLGPIVFEGNSIINLKPKQLEEYNEETSMEIYNDLAVDLDLQIRYKYIGIKRTRFPIIRCRRLRVPLVYTNITEDSQSLTLNHCSQSPTADYSPSPSPTPPLSLTRCSSRNFYTNFAGIIL